MRVFTESLPSGGASLTAYLVEPSAEMPAVSRRPAVLVFPGGGYYFCSDREAEPIALSFVQAGYQAFVLRYTVGESHQFPEPLRDAEDALRRIRQMAEEWHVVETQIAVCGFSAGGHLAAALSVMGQERPNATILGYPCILDSMNPILAFPVPSCDSAAGPDTPPVFLFHTAADELVPVENSLCYAAALARAKVPFELHIFPQGVHGLSLATPLTANGRPEMIEPRVAGWLPLCLAWLGELFATSCGLAS